MPRPCSICTSVQRAEIEAFYSTCKNLIHTADAYSVSKSALGRHMRLHYLESVEPIPTVYIEPEEPEEPEEPIEPKALVTPARHSIDAYERLLELVEKTNGVIEQAENTDNTQLLLWAIAESRKNFEAMLKIYEAQERIRSLYAGKEDVTSSFTFRYLREHYPVVLTELVEGMRRYQDAE